METEKIIKNGSSLIVIAWILIVGALVTVLPLNMADDKCYFGYTAVCPFSPISSILMILTAIYLILLKKKKNISKKTI